MVDTITYKPRLINGQPTRATRTITKDSSGNITSDTGYINPDGSSATRPTTSSSYSGGSSLQTTNPAFLQTPNPSLQTTNPDLTKPKPNVQIMFAENLPNYRPGGSSSSLQTTNPAMLQSSVPTESRVASAIASNIANGSQNLTVRPATNQGFTITTEKEKKGLLNVNWFGQENEIAISRATGKKYIVTRTQATGQNDLDYKTFLIPYTDKIKRGGVFSPASMGLDTSGAIDFSSGQPLTQKQKIALEKYITDKNIKEKSQVAGLGLALGGASTTVNTATKSVGLNLGKLTLGQTLRNFAVSGGLYALAPGLPETARQSAIALNPEAQKIDFENPKLRKTVQDAYNETNKIIYGSTTIYTNEQGDVLREERTKPKTNLLQTFGYSAFAPLKAVEGGDALPYAKEFVNNITPKLKAQGYSQKQIDAIVQVELLASQTGSALGLVATEVASEVGFRTIAKNTIPGFMAGTKGGTLKQGAKLGGILALESLPFGVAEGVTGLEVTKQAERSTTTLDEKIQAGAIGGAMASSFNAVGGVLTGRFGKTGGRVTQYVGWGLDAPGEFIGDKLTDIGSRGSLNIGIPGRVTTTSFSTPSTTTTKVVGSKTTTDSKEYLWDGLNDSSVYSPTQARTQTSTKTNAKTKTGTQTKTNNYTYSSIITPTSVVVPSEKGNIEVVNPFSNVDTTTGTETETGTVTRTQTDTGTGTQTTSVFNPLEVIIDEDTTTEVTTPTTTTSTTTSVNVPIVTPAGLPFLPFLPFGSVRPSKLRTKKLKYYNEFALAQKELKRLGGFRK